MNNKDVRVRGYITYSIEVFTEDLKLIKKIECFIKDLKIDFGVCKIENFE